jgi:hypothetical protein
MADPFTAGMKLRASDLNAIAATGVMIASQVSAGAGDALSWTTTESVGAALSAVPFVAGRKYLIEFTGVGNAASAGANMFLKLKYKAGSTVDTSGTQVPDGKIAPNISRGSAADNNPLVVRGLVTAPTTGPYVVVLTGRMNTSTGGIAADTSNHGWAFTVTCVNA